MNDEILRNKKAVLVTVFAAIFFVLVLCALTINLIKLAALTSKKAALEAAVAEANAKLEQTQREISYRKTDEYVDAYAREYLGMIGEKETGYIAK